LNAKPDSAVVNLGRHLLAEFYDCNSNILNNVQLIEDSMKEAAIACGATIVQSNFHLFNPFGVSGVVVIAESHLAIHTWPELGYAAVDLFTCGGNCDPKVAYEYLREKLGAGSAFYSELKRGLMNADTQQMIHSPFQVELQMASQVSKEVSPVAHAEIKEGQAV
jgi:S-adenosylmethionine decarboxylase proenzyme